MKNIILLIILIVFGFSLNAQTTSFVSVTTTDEINKVVDMPKMRGKFIYSIPEGETINVYGRGNSYYYEISYLDKIGYVYSTYLLDNVSLKDRKKFKSIRKNPITQLSGDHLGISSVSLEKLPIMTPGDELLRYTKLKNVSYTCYAFSAGLGIIVGVGGSKIEQGTVEGIAIVAGITAITGLILDVVATQHIGRAGLLLNESGIGLVIPLK